MSQLQNASFSASGKELLGRQNELEAETLHAYDLLPN